jgi:tRNA dimethylallyltransferase
MLIKKPKILVIIGPTASGKTKLAVKLAEEFDGEIVSADSRQVYRGMDIGTGKDLQEYKNIPYHLIDVADPNDDFSLAQYQKQAYGAIDDILKRKKLPIVVGGSGLYLQAVVDGYELSEAKPDLSLRENLEEKSVEELFLELKRINPAFAEKINNSDRNNKRRLIRYIEISKTSVNANKIDITRINTNSGTNLHESKARYEALILGLDRPKEELQERIHKRIIERLENEDMMGEVERLHNAGVSWKRLESFGLEYKFLSWHLQEKIDYDEMVEQLFTKSKQFAKRQMTWFRRWEKQGAKIIWIDGVEEAEEKIKSFI